VTRRARTLVALALSTAAVVGCSACSRDQSEDPHWSGPVGGVRVQWTSQPGVDLSTGVAVPVRAYLESYHLVQFTGELERAYPGFTDAVPPNEPAEKSDDNSTWARRPSEDVAVGSKLIGDLKFHVESIDDSGNSVRVTACTYNYALGKEQSDGTYQQLPEGGYAETRGIYGVRVSLVAPPDETTPSLPPQVGPGTSPDDSVFGGWRVVGYLTTAASSDREWPNKDDVEAACVKSAPDSLERRRQLTQGSQPADAFPTSPPIPGWPEASSA
jgi:hypothetical protein